MGSNLSRRNFLGLTAAAGTTLAARVPILTEERLVALLS